MSFFMVAIFIYFALRYLYPLSTNCKTIPWWWIPATFAYPLNYFFSFCFWKITLLNVVFWLPILLLSGVWICLFISSWSVRLLPVTLMGIPLLFLYKTRCFPLVFRIFSLFSDSLLYTSKLTSYGLIQSLELPRCKTHLFYVLKVVPIIS